jgi:hypothetical protein
VSIANAKPQAARRSGGKERPSGATLGQALVFASAIGCLFGVLAVLARLV